MSAPDPETARAAVDRIKVEYAVLPGVYSLDEAMAPGAPLVHDAPRVAFMGSGDEIVDLDRADTPLVQ